MPASSDDTYLESDHELSVTAHMLPGGGRRTHVHLAGEMDMAASTVLSGTIDWLTRLAPASVLLDLTEVTFACATLPNFVVRLRQGLPDGAELVLWRPRPMTRWVLQVTDMAAIAAIPEESTEHAREATERVIAP